MDFEPSFTFRSIGSDLKITLRKQQVTPTRLASIFKLKETGLFITEDWEDAQNPQSEFWEGGKFKILDNALCGQNFLVRGDPCTAPTPSEIAGTSNAIETSTPGPSGLLGRFKRPSSTTLSNKLSKKRAINGNASEPASHPSHSLRVTLATLIGDKFKSGEEMFFIINNNNCNVDDITAKVRRGFGKQGLVLYNSSGKEILDSEGTREMSFWKKPARRVYAVDETQKEGKEESINNNTKIDNIESNVAAILNMVQDGFVSAQLYTQLKEALECRICRDVIVTPPLLFSQCCKQLIACAECLERLGEDPACPNCRAPVLRTYSINAFDNILHTIGAVNANN